MAPTRAPPPRKHGKRKAGHIGFQSSEIAFIEDEMAALAAEYGLEVDQEVAASVHKRKEHKKKARLRRNQSAMDSAQNQGDATKSGPTLLPPPRRRVVIRGDFDGDHDLVQKILRNVLPDGATLGKCDVPSCGCTRGHRETTLGDAEDADVATECDVVRRGSCKKCKHGVLQHAIVFSDGEDSKPSGGQRLLSALYELVRTARLAGSVFRSRVWVAAVLSQIDKLLNHLKKQFAAGGTQNGQKTMQELQQEQIVLAELQSLHKKAETASQKAVSRDELPIEMAVAFDPMYFRVYYACIVLYGRACAAVPPPEDYFADIESFTPEVHKMTQAFVNQELWDDGDEIPTELFKSLVLPVSSGSSSKRQKEKTAETSGIALLDIYHLRFREGIRLFYEHSIGMHGEMDALLSNARGVLSGATAANAPTSGSAKTSKKHKRGKEDDTATTKTSNVVDVPAYELLTAWRNACRDWCCHLYAYATPTEEALRVMVKYSPIVEMGAGTGYWSALLQDRGADVMAFDACPPSLMQGRSEEEEPASKFVPRKKKHKNNEPKHNAYHGEVPTFTSVAHGGPETLKADESTHDRSLFLCYPPPGDDMARLSVKNFKGGHVIHVGEWQGDTGDRGFEKELVKKFVLVEEVELPNWGNSAYSLTVWKRKSKSDRGIDTAIKRLSCFHCHSSLLDAETDEDAEELKRCVLCKTNVYCSEECEEAGRRAHAAEHAKRLVFLEQEKKLDFENDLHYKPLQALKSEEEDESDDEDEDDKVVVRKTNWKTLTKKGEATEAENKAEKNSGAGFAFNFGA